MRWRMSTILWYQSIWPAGSRNDRVTTGMALVVSGSSAGSSSVAVSSDTRDAMTDLVDEYGAADEEISGD